jgi:vacuolar-type H+-ATPase subunit F/Vma7
VGASSGSAWVLGDGATVRGFRLAGFEGRVVASAGEARDALAELRAAGAALVLVTESLQAALADAGLDGALRPVVAVIPSAAGPRTGPSRERALGRAVRRALGMPAERRP